MSPDATPLPPPPPPEWSPLPITERRVLGVLIEKQKTSKSSDAYPLTLNALTLGCNQKSNRDPVLDLTDDDVEETLSSLQKKAMVMRITGGRVDRFRHLLYDTWTKNGPQLAVLAELLLRGPQTKGELRGRAARMDPIDTLDALEEVIKPLVERRLVVYLNAPDRRGTVLSHGFHLPDELARLKAHHASAPASAAEPDAAPVRTAVTANLEARLTDALADIAALKAAVAGLEAQVAELKNRVGTTPATP
jgi:uncharacterized protein YceH (UPF0502 family)